MVFILGCHLPDHVDLLSMQTSQIVLLLLSPLLVHDVVKVLGPFQFFFQLFILLFQEDDGCIEIVHSNNNVLILWSKICLESKFIPFSQLSKTVHTVKAAPAERRTWRLVVFLLFIFFISNLYLLIELADQPLLKRQLLIHVSAFFLIGLESPGTEASDCGELPELVRNRSHVLPHFHSSLPIDANRSVEHLHGLLLVGDDFFNLIQEDVIVVVNEINFPAPLIKDAFADVETVQKSVVVFKNFSERKVP